MFHRFIFLLAIHFLAYNFVYSQQDSLTPPESFQYAVNKDTRTCMGIPGTAYWQNSANYDIMVSILPEKMQLEGSETITYYNNSPDTLSQIVLKIYQNLYRKGSPRDVTIHPDDIHEGVEISFTEETEETLIDTLVDKGTNWIIHLKEPLLNGDSLKMGLSWKFQIPSKSDIRMGAMDDSAFFFGFWFPRIAVYDDLHGWDITPHTGNQEFYHDLGNYEVYIHVPQGYMVMATGMLQNEEVVLTGDILERYRKAKESDQLVSILKEKDLTEMNQRFRENVWIYKAENVPDFAFGVSNHHLWDAKSFLIDTASGNRTLIQAAYKPDSEDFKEVVEFSSQIIQYLSFEYPAYPYPFGSVSIFNGTNGSSGMEYPMIANNPSAERRGRTFDVTAHEITHNYFPFFVLTNETNYAWMDEAFAAMIPYRLQERVEPSLNRLTRYAGRISELANTIQHIPTMEPSSAISTRVPYYFTNYTKPAVALYILEDILGMSTFQNALLEYITVWQGKHPIPYDFFYLMNNATGKNLNWFWIPWFFEDKWPDLSILSVKEDLNKYQITVKNTGNLPVPVHLTIYFEDGSNYTIHKTAEVWKEGNNHLIVPVKTNKKVMKVQLGNDYIPDVKKQNNIYTK